MSSGSQFNSNTAKQDGGAISVRGAMQVALLGSQIELNRAQLGSGGGAAVTRTHRFTLVGGAMSANAAGAKVGLFMSVHSKHDLCLYMAVVSKHDKSVLCFKGFCLHIGR